MFSTGENFFAGVGSFGGFLGFVEVERHCWRSATVATGSWVIGGLFRCDKSNGSIFSYSHGLLGFI